MRGMSLNKIIPDFGFDDHSSIRLGGNANQMPDKGSRKSPTSIVPVKITPTERGNTNCLRYAQRHNLPMSNRNGVRNIHQKASSRSNMGANGLGAMTLNQPSWAIAFH